MIGQRITIEICRASTSELVTVDAWRTATPGVVVHESLGHPGWAVAHQRSGLHISMFANPESAMAFAAAIGEVDWTGPGVALVAVPAVERCVRRHAKKWGALTLTIPRPLPPRTFVDSPSNPNTVHDNA